jgi:hypothetical protein
MIVPLKDEFLLISGTRSFLLVAKANSLFALRIETPNKEYSQTIEPTDLIVVSAPEGGALEPAIMLADFVKTYHMPLIVFPKDHPGSKRFSYLVSVGPLITTSCTIKRGTHPEQHLVCSSDELSGTTIRAHPDGMEINGLPETASHRYVKYRMLTDLS